MTIQALRGTTDLFESGGTIQGDLARWVEVERLARRLSHRYGYSELRTPIIEEAALFLRTVGETTDIVQKEMFQFEDRGGRPIVLRPEGTGAIVRAYLEHHGHKQQRLAKFFYLGPMFRAERPQAGRLRQFHQYGVEAIGSSSPWLDADVIALCLDFLRQNRVTSYRLWLSSMGCRTDQQASAEGLRQRLLPHRQQLCQDCQGRLDKNVFRVLDCKKPADHELAWKLAGSPFLLCAECQAHFDQVREALRHIGIAFEDTHVFARGLDYYTRTVFEVRADGLGAQDAVAAGGRYDHLVEELGGPPTGAIGFAVGIERVLLAAPSAPGEGALASQPRTGVYVAAATPALTAEIFRLVQALRQKGVISLMDYDGGSLKAQLREADRLRCRWVAILGEQEQRRGVITIKEFDDQHQHEQREVPRADFVDTCVSTLTHHATCHHP